jgi:hypothetical protein
MKFTKKRTKYTKNILSNADFIGHEWKLCVIWSIWKFVVAYVYDCTSVEYALPYITCTLYMQQKQSIEGKTVYVTCYGDVSLWTP